MIKRTAALGILALVSGLWGCATRPQAGSLAEVQLDAGREAAKACYHDSRRAHPNVPTFDAWQACWRAYANVGATPQRVTY
jgi:hypothetical protein